MADLTEFSEAGRDVMLAAKAFCLAAGAAEIGPRHLFQACAFKCPNLATATVVTLGVSEAAAAKLVRAAAPAPGAGSVAAEKRKLSADALALVANAQTLAAQRPEAAQPLIAPVHLWAAACAGAAALQGWLLECGWSAQQVSGLAQAAEAQLPARQSGQLLQLSDEQRAIMKRLCQRNLTELARAGQVSTAWGVDKPRQDLVRCLLRRDKRNAVLTGRAGVGKTKLVEDLACRIAAGELPDLAGCEVFELDLVSLTRGTHLVGSLAERFAQLTEVLRAHAEHLILFIDELHMIVGVSMGGEQMDLSNALKPMLVDSRVRVIGATTTEEYTRHIEKDSALSRRFSEVKVPEPDRDAMLQLLREIAPRYEAYHRVAYTHESLQALYDLTQRYLPNQAFPSKAVDLMDEVGVHVRMRAGSSVSGGARPEVTARDVGDALGRVRGIAVDEPAADLAALLSERVIGQDEAAQMLADAVITSAGRFGSRRAKGARASILFLGPPGVGKSYMAETLADILSPGRKTMLTLDMTEFAGDRSGEQARFRLLGAPPPYVGWQDGGLLTAHAVQHPTSVVLVDELDKAGNEARHILLKVLNDGWVQDGMKRIVSFRGIIFILTANAARELWERPKPRIGFMSDGSSGLVAGGDVHATEKAVHDALVREGFSPELLSRVSHTVLFRELDRSVLLRIVAAHLAETRDAALTEELAALDCDADALAAWVVDHAGAAPDARRVAVAFERFVETPLARWRWQRTGPASPVLIRLEPRGELLELTERADAAAGDEVRRLLLARLASTYGSDESRKQSVRSAGARIAG